MKAKTKDRISNVSGFTFAVSGALAGVGASGATLPQPVITACIVLAAVSGAVIGWLTGKPVK